MATTAITAEQYRKLYHCQPSCRSQQSIPVSNLDENIRHQSSHTNNIRKLTSSQLIQITTAFDTAIISPDNGSLDQPASQLCLPLCLQNSSLMHAWLSCGTAFVTRAQPGGIQKALVHYQQAVKGLATALSVTGLTSPEWKVATVLLLHTFEVSHFPLSCT